MDEHKGKLLIETEVRYWKRRNSINNRRKFISKLGSDE